MIVYKRDGRVENFREYKIYYAIIRAFKACNIEDDENIASEITQKIKFSKKDYNVEEIQDIVEKELMNSNHKEVAKAYILYREKRNKARKSSIDDIVKEYLDGKNEYLNTENSNKNSMALNVQRDYFAGILSTDISTKYLLTDDIVKAHDEGIIHFHDIDYFAQKSISNCSLINLKDMLENGTIINNVKIDSPHRFLTACTIATQIILGVSSNQYGGCTISLTHLAPFLRKSYNFYIDKYKKRGFSDSDVKKFADEDLKKELQDGVQTFNYQLNSMTNSNGQSPFVSVFMYLSEDKEYINEVSMIIEEFLKQRILGFKNKKNVYITPAFPKLLYVLEENNVYKESKYYYLTVLAAKCTAKRMVPDYISEKKIKELKDGDCFPCMGCVDGKELVTYKIHDQLFVESFERMWNRLEKLFRIQNQYFCLNYNLFMDCKNVSIYDSLKGFVEVKRIVRNINTTWCDISIEKGRTIRCTLDHPFHTNRGRVLAKDLRKDDEIIVNYSQYTTEAGTQWENDYAWLCGLIVCDGTLNKSLIVSLNAVGEDDIIDKLVNVCAKYNILTNVNEINLESCGHYKNVTILSSNLKNNLIQMFEGVNKNVRHIPNQLFSMNYDVRLHFLAGMIDADGFVNKNGYITIGSTNKELALQQCALIQSLGYQAFVYLNHYKKNSDNVRYFIQFDAFDEIINVLSCKKKRKNYILCRKREKVTLSKNKITAIKYCTNPGYSYDVTTSSDHFEVSGIYSYNCRSFLMPYKDENGNSKYYGRFNQGVVTINLPDIALSSKKDFNKFWKLFEERTELCHKALRLRYKRLSSVTSNVAPLLWQDGAFARLKENESILKLLHNNYSSISLGYAGLYECVKTMTGKNFYDNDEALAFAIEVMKRLKKQCDKWQKEENIGYSLYGSPIETATYKFAKCLKKRFGENVFVKMDGIDRNYITNSVHVPVFVDIDPYKKLEIEALFQKYSTGGYISYIECADLTKNIDIVLDIIRFIYDHTMYAELNTKSDYCQKCGYDGEIKIIDVDGKLDWECPNCGNRDHNSMNVARRTCGYIGSNFWNQGRTDEIKNRVTHLDDKEV